MCASFAGSRVAKVSSRVAGERGGDMEGRKRVRGKVGERRADVKLGANTLHPANINTRNEMANGIRVVPSFPEHVS